MNSNKQLLGFVSMKSIDGDGNNSKSSPQLIIEKLVERKKDLQTQISAAQQKANYFQSIQEKVKELQQTKEAYHNNLSQITFIQQKLVHRRNTQKKYKQQLMALVISSQLLQLQLQQSANQLIHSFNFHFGYECQNPSSKYFHLLLIELQTQISDPGLSIRKNIMQMLKGERGVEEWGEKPIQWVIQKKISSRLFRSVLKKLNKEQNRGDYETWMKYIRVLRDLEEYKGRNVEIEGKVTDAMEIKSRFQQQKSKIKRLKQKINRMEKDIQEKQNRLQQIRKQNKHLCQQMTSLKPYEHQYNENNPENTTHNYFKELAQIQQAIKYFETKLHYDVPTKIKSLKTLQTSGQYTNVLNSDIFLNSPIKRTLNNSSLKKIWR